MISIFAKPAFLNTANSVPFISKEKSYKGHGHLQRVSSMIRGDQIADYLGAKLNPESGFEEDICIYVKPSLPKGITEFNFQGKKNYIDIVDGWGLLPMLEKYSEVGVIACSRQDQEILSNILPNKIIFIPQHHCNFDREKRTRKAIKTIGVIGTEGAWQFLPKGLEEELDKVGVKLLKYSKFFSRQDIIDFYKQIDLQLVWRPYRMRLSNPLKIVNASSFGIPSVVLHETVFQEMLGCYLRVTNVEEILGLVDKMIKDPEIYKYYSKTCLEKAEDYHIENVAKEYKKL